MAKLTGQRHREAHDVVRWTAVVEVVAGCECGWGSRAKNAMGNAKRHARATGHVVDVLQQLGVTYAPPGVEGEELRARRSACYEAQDNA